MSKPRVFFDTSALIAAVLSEGGAARALLQLGELGLVELWVGRRVLEEADRFLLRKSPHNRGLFARLLDVAEVRLVTEPSAEALAEAAEAVDYAPDAYVVAEALTSGAEFLVSHDKQHLVGNARLAGLAMRTVTPGECLGEIRARL